MNFISSHDARKTAMEVAALKRLAVLNDSQLAKDLLTRLDAVIRDTAAEGGCEVEAELTYQNIYDVSAVNSVISSLLAKGFDVRRVQSSLLPANAFGIRKVCVTLLITW